MIQGIGVVNNISNSRFNKGAPTVNYIPSPFNYSLYAYASGPVDTTTLNERGKVINVKRYTVTQAVNTARAAIFPTGLTTGTAYTFSFKWKYNGSITSSPTVGVSAAKGNPEGGANNNSFTSETANTISIGGGWYLTTYTFTFASVPTGKAMLTFGLNTGSTAGFVNETFDIYEAQFEVKSFKSPYTAGTRSSTQSLTDLTRTTNIDVSNVSFDSTGQPTFDGTNDYIAVTNLLASESIGAGTQLTISLWLNCDQYGNRMPFSTGQSGNDRIYYWTENSLNTWRVGNYTSTTGHGSLPSVGNWFNTVLVIDGTNITVYLNGQEDYTGSYTGFTTEHYATFGRHGATSSYYYDGKIANAKIYNRALSADEVQQNYRAYKNRFDL
jgi:hypothetical protein